MSFYIYLVLLYSFNYVLGGLIISGQSQVFESRLSANNDTDSSQTVNSVHKFTVEGLTGTSESVLLFSSPENNRTHPIDIGDKIAWINHGTIEYTYDIPTITRVPREQHVFRGRYCQRSPRHSMHNATLLEKRQVPDDTHTSAQLWQTMARDYKAKCDPLTPNEDNTFRDDYRGCVLEHFPVVTPENVRIAEAMNRFKRFLNTFVDFEEDNEVTFQRGFGRKRAAPPGARRQKKQSSVEAQTKVLEALQGIGQNLEATSNLKADQINDLYRRVSFVAEMNIEAQKMIEENAFETLETRRQMKQMGLAMRHMANQQDRIAKGTNAKIGQAIGDVQVEMTKLREEIMGVAQQIQRSVLFRLTVSARGLESMVKNAEFSSAFNLMTSLVQLNNTLTQNFDLLRKQRQDFLDLKQKVTRLYQAYRHDTLERLTPLSIAVNVFAAEQALKDLGFVPITLNNGIPPRNLSTWTTIGFRRWHIDSIRVLSNVNEHFRQATNFVSNQLHERLPVKAWIPYRYDPRIAKWWTRQQGGRTYTYFLGDVHRGAYRFSSSTQSPHPVFAVSQLTTQQWVFELVQKGYDLQGLEVELELRPNISALIRDDIVVMRDMDKGYITAVQSLSNSPTLYLSCTPSENIGLGDPHLEATLDKPDYPWTVQRFRSGIIMPPPNQQFQLRLATDNTIVLNVCSSGNVQYDRRTFHIRCGTTTNCLTMDNTRKNSDGWTQFNTGTNTCHSQIGQQFVFIPVHRPSQGPTPSGLDRTVYIQRLSCCGDSLPNHYGPTSGPLYVTRSLSGNTFHLQPWSEATTERQQWRMVFSDNDLNNEYSFHTMLTEDYDEDGDSLGLDPPIKLGRPILLSTPSCGGKHFKAVISPFSDLRPVSRPGVDVIFKPQVADRPGPPPGVSKRSLSELHGSFKFESTESTINDTLLNECLQQEGQSYIVVEAPNIMEVFERNRNTPTRIRPGWGTFQATSSAKIPPVDDIDTIILPSHLLLKRFSERAPCSQIEVICRLDCESNQMCASHAQRQLPNVSQRVNACRRYFPSTASVLQGSPYSLSTHRADNSWIGDPGKICGSLGSPFQGACQLYFKRTMSGLSESYECPAWGESCAYGNLRMLEDNTWKRSPRSRKIGSTKLTEAKCLRCPEGFELERQGGSMFIENNKLHIQNTCARGLRKIYLEEPTGLNVLNIRNHIDMATERESEFFVTRRFTEIRYWHMCYPTQKVKSSDWKSFGKNSIKLPVELSSSRPNVEFEWDSIVYQQESRCDEYSTQDCPNRCEVILDVNNTVFDLPNNIIQDHYVCSDPRPDPCVNLNENMCVRKTVSVNRGDNQVQVPICAWHTQENACKPMTRRSRALPSVKVHCSLYEVIQGGTESICLDPEYGGSYCVVKHTIAESSVEQEVFIRRPSECMMKPLTQDEFKTAGCHQEGTFCQYSDEQEARAMYDTVQNEMTITNCEQLSTNLVDLRCEVQLTMRKGATVLPRCQYIGIDEGCVEKCDMYTEDIHSLSLDQQFKQLQQCINNRWCFIHKANVHYNGGTHVPAEWKCLWQYDPITGVNNRMNFCEGVGQFASDCIYSHNRCFLLEPVNNIAQKVSSSPPTTLPCFTSGHQNDNSLWNNRCLVVWGEQAPGNNMFHYTCRDVNSFIPPLVGLCDNFQDVGYCDASSNAEALLLENTLNQHCEHHNTMTKCVNTFNPRTQNGCAWAEIQGVGMCFDDDERLLDLQIESPFLKRITRQSLALSQRHVGSIVAGPLGLLTMWMNQPPRTSQDNYVQHMRIFEADVHACHDPFDEDLSKDRSHGLYCGSERNAFHPQTLFTRYYQEVAPSSHVNFIHEKFDIIYACKMERILGDDDSDKNSYVCIPFSGETLQRRLNLNPVDPVEIDLGQDRGKRMLYPLYDVHTMKPLSRDSLMWKLEVGATLSDRNQPYARIRLEHGVSYIAKVTKSELWNARWVQSLSDTDMTGDYEFDIQEQARFDIQFLYAYWTNTYGDFPQLWGIRLPEGVVLRDLPPGTYDGEAFQTCREWSIAYMRPETLRVRKYMNLRTRCTGSLIIHDTTKNEILEHAPENCVVDDVYSGNLPKVGDLFIHFRDSQDGNITSDLIFNVPDSSIKVSGPAKQRCGHVGYIHSQGEDVIDVPTIFRELLRWDPECASSSPTNWASPRDKRINANVVWEMTPLTGNQTREPEGDTLSIGFFPDNEDECLKQCRIHPECIAFVWSPCEANCIDACKLFSRITGSRPSQRTAGFVGEKNGETLRDYCGTLSHKVINSDGENPFYRLRLHDLPPVQRERWLQEEIDDLNQDALVHLFDQWAEFWTSQGCTTNLVNFIKPGEQEDQFYIWYKEYQARNNDLQAILEEIRLWTQGDAVQCGKCVLTWNINEDAENGDDETMMLQPCNPVYGTEGLPRLSRTVTLISETSARHGWCIIGQNYDIIEHPDSITFRLKSGLGQVKQTFPLKTDRILRYLNDTACPIMERGACHPALGSPCSIRFHNPTSFSVPFTLRMRNILQPLNVPFQQLEAPHACDNDLRFSLAPNSDQHVMLPICQGRFNIQLWNPYTQENCSDIIQLDLLEYGQGIFNDRDNLPPMFEAIDDRILERVGSAIERSNLTAEAFLPFQLELQFINSSMDALRNSLFNGIDSTRNQLSDSISRLNQNLTDLTENFRGMETRIPEIIINMTENENRFREISDRVNTNIGTLNDFIVDTETTRTEFQNELARQRQDFVDQNDRFEKALQDWRDIVAEDSQTKLKDVKNEMLEQAAEIVSEIDTFNKWRRTDAGLWIQWGIFIAYMGIGTVLFISLLSCLMVCATRMKVKRALQHEFVKSIRLDKPTLQKLKALIFKSDETIPLAEGQNQKSTATDHIQTKSRPKIPFNI